MKTMLEKYGQQSVVSLTKALSTACREGHVEDVKYLLSSDELKIHADLSFMDFDVFKEAASYGHLEVVKYLADLPVLYNSKTKAIYEALLNSAANHKLDVVEFILTSPKLKKNLDINQDEGGLISEVCIVGDLEVLKFLLNSEKLKKIIDIHAGVDVAMSWVIRNKDLAIAEYLVFERNIEKTEAIQQHIDHMNGLFLQNMFLARELSKNLQADVAGENLTNVSKKSKI